MRLVIGIVIGGTLAMMFPEVASGGYEMLRDYINSAARIVAGATGGAS